MTYKENSRCSLYLGVHVAEQVLSHVFKDVVVMPLCNRGYDFICNGGKKIDVKCACLGFRGNWQFKINRNTTADYFLCLAFDNRDDLNPLYAWLLPADKYNHLRGTAICPSTVGKWEEYRLDISKVLECCDQIRDGSLPELPRAEGEDLGHPSTLDRRLRKTRLTEYIEDHWHEMKESKLLAMYSLEEGISLVSTRIYLGELIMEDRVGYKSGVLRVIE